MKKNVVDFNCYITLLETMLKQSGGKNRNFTVNRFDYTAAEETTGYIYLQYSPDPKRKFSITPVKEGDLFTGYYEEFETPRPMTKEEADFINEQEKTMPPMDDTYEIKITRIWGLEVEVSNRDNSVTFYIDEQMNPGEVCRCDCEKGEAFKNWTENNCIEKFSEMLTYAYFIDEKTFEKYNRTLLKKEQLIEN